MNGDFLTPTHLRFDEYHTKTIEVSDMQQNAIERRINSLISVEVKIICMYRKILYKLSVNHAQKKKKKFSLESENFFYIKFPFT